MGNALKQHRERHTVLRSDRYTYNPGSTLNSLDADSWHMVHLDFDLSTANPEDRSISREWYQSIMPNLYSLTLTSEPNTPSLYNTTPNVLLGLAPNLQYVKIIRVNRLDISSIEKMFPLLHNAQVHLHLDQLQTLTKRNPASFQNVTTLKVDVANHDGVTLDSLVVLHEWASSNYMLKLDLKIQKWTVPLQNVFSQLSESLHIHQDNQNGLNQFFLHIDEIEEPVFETKFDFWNRFIRDTTTVVITIKAVPHTTHKTVGWLSELLDRFMKTSSKVNVKVTLWCDTPDWPDMIDPLFVHFVERQQDAYLRARYLHTIPTHLPNDWETHILSHLIVAVHVMDATYTPRQNTNRKEWTGFTTELEDALFSKKRVVIRVHRTPQPVLEPPAKKQRTTN